MASAVPPRRSQSATGPSGGNGGFLTRSLGPLPVWAWLLVGAGGVVVGIIILRGRNKSSADTTGNPPTPAEIDPYTGVPYAVEESIDKATGIPFYYEYPGGRAPDGSPSPMQPEPGPPAPPSQPEPPRPGPGPSIPASPAPGQPPGHPAPGPGTIPGSPAPGQPPGVPPAGPNPPPGRPVGPLPPPPNPASQARQPPPANPDRPHRRVTVRPWPQQDSSLYSIWQQNAHGIPWQQWEGQVLRLNPLIHDPNLLYPNESIMIP